MPRPSGPPIRLPPPAKSLGRLPKLADRAYAYVKGLILDGGRDAGDLLPVEAVARILNASRQPVRDAMNRLASEGLVQVIPQVGCRVTVPDADEVADFYQLFAASEAVLAALAAERRTHEEASALATLHADIESQARGGGAPTARDPLYRRLNRQLHERIHALARSPIAAHLAAGMWDRSDFYLRAAFGSLYFSPDVIAAHRRMVAGITAGDGTAARTATEAHLLAVGARTARRLRAQPARS